MNFQNVDKAVITTPYFEMVKQLLAATIRK